MKMYLLYHQSSHEVKAEIPHENPTRFMDAMIAATAKVHGLTIATRNVADFQALGLEVLNPFTPA